MKCTQCGVALTRADVLDYYELRQIYVTEAGRELAERHLDRLIGVDTTQTRIEGSSSLHQDRLIGLFCGATCLSQYVQAHIAPDAATE